jgi:hypothetical protein
MKPTAGHTLRTVIVAIAASGLLLGTSVAGSAPALADGTSTVTSVPAVLTPPTKLPDSDVHIGAIQVAPLLSKWAPLPTSVTYQWMRGGVDVPDATQSEYTVTSADVGFTLQLREVASLDGYADVTWISPPTDKVLPDFTSIPTPVIVGTPRVGVPLTLSEAAWTPKATSGGNTWYVNGIQVASNVSHYTPVQANLGGAVTVNVFGWSDTTAGSSILSAATAPVLASVFKLGAVKLGTVNLNKPISPAFIHPPSGTSLHYQWARNGKALSGTTGATYTPEGKDWNAKLSVKVTIAGVQVATSSVSSNSSLVHTGSLGSRNAQGIVKAGEAVIVGALIRAAHIGTAVPGMKVHYKWVLNGHTVGTGSSWKVPASAHGKSLKVFVRTTAPHLKKSGWYAATSYVVQ